MGGSSSSSSSRHERTMESKSAHTHTQVLVPEPAHCLEIGSSQSSTSCRPFVQYEHEGRQRQLPPHEHPVIAKPPTKKRGYGVCVCDWEMADLLHTSKHRRIRWADIAVIAMSIT